MKKFGRLLIALLAVLFMVPAFIIPAFAQEEEELPKERDAKTYSTDEATLILHAVMPEDASGEITPVLVSEEQVREWSGISDLRCLSYRFYEISLPGCEPESPPLIKVYPHFQNTAEEVWLFYVHDVQIGTDAAGNPKYKTVGDPVSCEYDGECLTWSAELPGRWLIVGRPNDYVYLQGLINQLYYAEAVEDDAGAQKLESMLTEIDDMADYMRACGVTDEQLFSQLSWDIYNTKRDELEEYRLLSEPAMLLFAAPYVEPPETEITISSFSGGLYCGGPGEKVEATIKNKSESVEIEIASLQILDSEGAASGNFTITDEPSSKTIAPGEEYSFSILSLEGLTASASGTYKLNVAYQYNSGSEMTPLSNSKEFGFNVSHTFAFSQLFPSLGWCLCESCDAYDSGFSGKFTYGAEKTWFKSQTPQLVTNLLFRDTHSYILVIDGKEIVNDTYVKYVIYCNEGENVARIQLNNDYIVSLTPGKHTIRLTEKDGNGNLHYALSWIRISSSSVPVTGDSADSGVMLFLAAASAAGIVLSASALGKRKRQ